MTEYLVYRTGTSWKDDLFGMRYTVAERPVEDSIPITLGYRCSLKRAKQFIQETRDKETEPKWWEHEPAYYVRYNK